jgi:transcriptional regulator with XRE-family HTH domain
MTDAGEEVGQEEDVLEAKRWLRERRGAVGLSQKTLAEIVGVKRRTIVSAESLEPGSSLPHGTTLWRILQALDGLADGPPLSGGPLQELRDEVAEGLAALERGIERIEARLDDSDGQADEGNGQR